MMLSEEIRREVEPVSIDSVLNYINHREPSDFFPYAEKSELSFLTGKHGLILREAKYSDSSELEAPGHICGEIAFNDDGTFSNAVFFRGQQQFFWEQCSGSRDDYYDWIYNEKLEDFYKNNDVISDDQIYSQIMHFAKQTGIFIEWLFFMYGNFIEKDLLHSLYVYSKMLELKSIRLDEEKGSKVHKSMQQRIKEVLPRGMRTYLYELGGLLKK